MIVIDACCLIDLRKGELLNVICKLPYQFVVPLPVRESEVLDHSDSEWRVLEEGRMITYDLPPNEISQVLVLSKCHPSLSFFDCCCIVTSLVHSGILLTGDAQLRKAAKNQGLQVHGVLMIIDKLATMNICEISLLRQALEVWLADNSVFLPRDEINSRLKKLKVAKT